MTAAVIGTVQLHILTETATLMTNSETEKLMSSVMEAVGTRK